MQERNELDRKMQSNLEACLQDINSHRSKQQNQCSLVVKEMTTLLPEVEDLQQEVESESIVTKEILKKIYGQFTEQIDQLKEMIEDERADRENEQETLLKKLEETYLNVHNNILSIRRSRQKSEKMLVDLLERVIEKVKNQLAN